VVNLSNPLPRSDKIVAQFGVIFGFALLLYPIVMTTIVGAEFSLFDLLSFALFGSGSLVGGLYGLDGKLWAFWLLLAVFAIQAFEYRSNGFFFSFIGPISRKPLRMPHRLR
jgi:hypothetical protein